MRLKLYILLYMFVLICLCLGVYGYSVSVDYAYTIAGGNTFVQIYYLNSTSYSCRYNTFGVSNGNFAIGTINTSVCTSHSVDFLSDYRAFTNDMSYDGSYTYESNIDSDQIFAIRNNDIRWDAQVTGLNALYGLISIARDSNNDYVIPYEVNDLAHAGVKVYLYNKALRNFTFKQNIKLSDVDSKCKGLTQRALTSNNNGVYLLCFNTTSNGRATAYLVKYTLNSSNMFYPSKYINATDFDYNQYSGIVAVDSQKHFITCYYGGSPEINNLKVNGVDRDLIVLQRNKHGYGSMYLEYYDKDLNYLSNSSWASGYDCLYMQNSYRNHWLGYYINSSLPIVNSTSVATTCFNKTTGKANVNISLTLSNMGDGNVYYSMADLQRKVSDYINYEDFVTGGSDYTYNCEPDKGFMYSGLIQNNNSYSDADVLCSSYALLGGTICLYSKVITRYNITSGQYYDACVGEFTLYSDTQEFLISSGKSFDVNSTYFESFYLKQPYSIYQLKLYSSLGINIMNVTFNRTSYGNLSIKVNNVVVSNKYLQADHSIDFYAYMYPNKSQIKTDFVYYSQNLIPTETKTTSVNFTDFKYVGHRSYLNIVHLNSWNPQVVIEKYYFKGLYNLEYVGEWFSLPVSNNKASINFNSYVKGKRYYYLYITDSYNKPLNNFNTYELESNIVSCDEYVDLSPDFKTFTKQVRTFEYNSCTSFSDVLGDLPLSLCSIISLVTCIIAVLLTIAIIISMSTYVHLDMVTSLNIGLMFWSVFMLLSSFVIYYSNTWKLVIGIIMSLSVVGFIVRIFFTNGGTNE